MLYDEDQEIYFEKDRIQKHTCITVCRVDRTENGYKKTWHFILDGEIFEPESIPNMKHVFFKQKKKINEDIVL